jgi:predicted kinase
MKTFIILRGLPGAGKTTLIQYLEKQYTQQASVCSADHFWYGSNPHTPENYKFDITKLSQAHGSCKSAVTKALNGRKPLIIIDNTNIRIREYKDYIKMAVDKDYELLSHAITGMSAEDSMKLTLHGVPLDTCKKMLQAFMPIGTIEKEGRIIEVKEVIHNYLDIRKGVFGTGKF